MGRNRYIGYLMTLPTRAFKNLRVGLDCANGASAIDTELARTMWQYDLRATELYNCIYYNHYGITLPNDYTRKLPVL